MSRSGETMCKSTNEICTTFDKALQSGLSTAGSDQLATIKLDLNNAKAELTSLRAKSEQAKSFKVRLVSYNLYCCFVFVTDFIHMLNSTPQSSAYSFIVSNV